MLNVSKALTMKESSKEEGNSKLITLAFEFKEQSSF